MEPIKKAVLLSGGVDSICLTYGIRPEVAYTIEYGQNAAEREVYVSEIICKKLGIVHKTIKVNCRELGSGNMASKTNSVHAPSNEWWPFRNQLIITLSMMQAIIDGVTEIHLASVKSDKFHKDGTREFYSLINSLTSYQEGAIKVKCETLDYYSHELAEKYKVPIEYIVLAHSCHISNIACGTCSGCLKQIRVKEELKIE